MSGNDYSHAPYTLRTIQDGDCPTYWGTHFCDLPAGHSDPHTCYPNLTTDGKSCGTRTGREPEIQHIDPTDSCGNLACDVCFQDTPDMTFPGDVRRKGRSGPAPEHDVRLCRWCWAVGDNTPADEIFTKLPNGHTRWNIRSAVEFSEDDE